MYRLSYIVLIAVSIFNANILCSSEIEDKDLETIMMKVYDRDQAPRKILDSLLRHDSNDYSLFVEVTDHIEYNDSLNQSICFPIIDSLIINNLYDLSERDSNTLFLVIQHADLAYQLKYISFIEALTNRKLIDISSYMMFIDRIQVKQQKRQFYGYQFCCLANDVIIQYPVDISYIERQRDRNIADEPNPYGKMYPPIVLDDTQFAVIISVAVVDRNPSPFEIWHKKQLVAKTDSRGFCYAVIDKKELPTKISIKFKEKLISCKLKKENYDFTIYGINCINNRLKLIKYDSDFRAKE